VGALEAAGARVVLRRMPVLRKAALRPAGLVRLLADAAAGLGPALRLARRSGRGGIYVNTTIAPWWLLVGRLARRRVVCHVHEAEWPGPRLAQRALLASLRAAHVVVANSRFTQRALVDRVPSLAGRTTAVVNPVPAPAAPVPARARLTGPVELLFLGRLSPRKGPDVAVAALAELLARGVDARLTVAGSVFPGYEWFEADLRAAVAAAQLADRVTFLGFRPDVWPVLAAADVVLVPSLLDESFGNAAVEAVLAARPTVVSALGGLREATAGYGAVQVVPVGRPAAWADAVQRAVDEWPRFRDAARSDAAEARRRHAVGPYRRRVADVVLGPGRPAPVRAAAEVPA
jgi:glycosyltransferase involved in cell wall biosynthesis